MDEDWGGFIEQPIGAAPAGPGGTAGPDQWQQFVDPAQPQAAASPFNKDAFAAKFAGPLAGKADVIEQKAQQYDVPPALASAIIAQETGWGKFVTGNNVAGMMHGKEKMQFGSIDEGIDKAVANIAKQYERSGRSLEGLRDIYAPLGAKNDPNGLNKDWLPGVSKIMGLLQ